MIRVVAWSTGNVGRQAIAGLERCPRPSSAPTATTTPRALDLPLVTGRGLVV